MERRFLELTNTAYKLLDFFPASDPLRSRASEKVLSIMEKLGSGFDKTKLLEDINVLLGYWEIGRQKKWISGLNCLIICNEYEKIKKEIGPIVKLKRVEPKQTQPFKTTPRQEKILAFLRKNEEAQVSSLMAVLPDVTKRTIRRDLDELLQQGGIVRSGEFSKVIYKIANKV